ncbi:MAG: RNA polymerase subunit sigma-70, partial [Oscillospiraceae bacterium]|nr:RNA polymerase subunit sigma-70 [Oscillospiraceae bacterium]
MVDTAILLLMNSLLLILRISPGDSFPKPLSAEEEREYLARWAQHGDMDARNKLVEHNLRLVAHIMKKYYTQTDDVDDLISIGTIGLIKGINTYKGDKGVRLATYASRCIENE